MPDKKQEILEAAKQLFNTQGYSKTSVDDISAAIGMRKSSLYYYFKNKEDIFVQSSENEWRRIFSEFRAEANKSKDPETKLITYIRQSLDYYEQLVIENEIPIKAFIETRNMYRSFIDDINQGSIDFYANCIQEGQTMGIFKACNTKYVANTLSLIKFSIQFDQLSIYMEKPPELEDWHRIRDLVIDATQLIISGIKL
ncbi:TetR/AcrR family transcriptional regulator [Reichenbachiella versicolor]|uniref:TetR/AcrR family transcriptional regulator n=1 Tax=Reichenbachiella versicolor TaxID=1821036 RepID=UPI000D6E1D1C|nr:TetR/AcrR family transcriptional regulator [Reichenbachiella versicolor]